MKKLIIAILFLCGTATAEITINATEVRPSGETIHYFTIINGENVYKWHGAAPLPSEAKLLKLIQGKIAKGTWHDTHPSIFSFANEVERDAAVAAAKDLAESLSFADVDSYVENQFADHTAAQRVFFKKIGKAVLYLLKAKNK